MSSVFYLSVALAIFSAISLLSHFVTSRNARITMSRVREVTEPRRRDSRIGVRKQAATKRMFEVVHWVRLKVGLPEDATLRARLLSAGYRGSGPVDLYIAARVLSPLIALILGSFIPFNRMFCMLALPALAYLAPDIILTRLVKRRRESIRLSIPDAIDLLVICVDAGLGIDQALLRVSQELGVSHPAITEELLQINREQRAGKARIEAWQEMAERTGLPEVLAFSNMLMQTERFGTPIARALNSFSETTRLKRRQAAEEAAAKTTVKIIFPLVLFVFPSMFIILLGPAALTIVRGMSTMGK